MPELAHPLDRDDGKPWIPWTSGSEYRAVLPGHRERVEMCCWYDRDRQSLVLTITQYDESMSRFLPCWAQLSMVETGPFFAKAEVCNMADMFADTIIESYGLGSDPG